MRRILLVVCGVAATGVLEDDVGIERGLLESGLGAAEADASAAPPPVVDLASADAPAKLWDAASRLGFFTVVNHGIEEALIESAFEAARDFFLNNEVDVKRSLSPYAAHLNAGYEHMSQVRPSTGLPDVKESFQVTARPDVMATRWPSATIRNASMALMAAAEGLAATLMTLLEKKIPHLEAGTLAEAHTLWTNESQVTLRMLHYPPPVEAPPGSFRAGAHTDWGCVTLLFQQPGNEGLECAANPRRGATGWVPVDPVPGGVAVNVGDMLARWSHGMLLSNLHRVRMPTTATHRYSLAYFAQADKHRLISIRDGDRLTSLTAEAYIKGRLKSNYDSFTDEL